MSSTLKGNILGTGTLEDRIFDAINIVACDGSGGAPTDPCVAQEQFAKRLANAIATGVALGVQEYLNNTVKTINKPTLVASGPIPHTHANEPQFDLKAP